MKILIFTSNIVGYKCLQYLLKNFKKDKFDIFITDYDSKFDFYSLIFTNNNANFISASKLNFLIKNKVKYDWILNLWGSKILNKNILNLTKDSLNIHPSYLPYGKGKDPTIWTLKYNYPAGVTLHKISEKIDAGDIIFQTKIKYSHPIKGVTLYDKSIKTSISFFIKKWQLCRLKKFTYKKQFKNNIATKIRRDLFEDELVHFKDTLTLKNFLSLQKPNNFINLDKNLDLKKIILKILRHDFNDDYYSKIVIGKKYFKPTILFYKKINNFKIKNFAKVIFNSKQYFTTLNLDEIKEYKPDKVNYTYIHIGGHKTASTLFQRNLFNKPDFSFVGNDCIDYSNYKESINSLIDHDIGSFDFRVTKKNLISKFSNSNKINIFSCEDIVSSNKLSLVSQRLKIIYPYSKIIFIIRNQIDAIRSLYLSHGSFLKYVPKKFWRNYVSFNDWIEYLFEFSDNSYLKCFEYYKIFETFLKDFKEEDIHILVYEDIIKNPKIFSENFSKILNCDPNLVLNTIQNHSERRSPSYIQHLSHKVLSRNSFTKKIYNLLDKSNIFYGNSYNFKIGNAWKDKIIMHYKLENMKINKIKKLNLKKYNYPMP